LFREPDESGEVRANMCDVVCGVWSHVRDWVNGEIGNEGVRPYWVPVHRLRPVESAGEDSDGKSVVGSVVMAEGVVVAARG
jgi:hypothetical protein